MSPRRDWLILSSRRERVLDLYAKGATMRAMASKLGHRSPGYVAGVIVAAREAGDARAAPRLPGRQPSA